MQTTLQPDLSAKPNLLQRWWRDPSIRFPTLIFIAARVLTLIVAVVTVRTVPVVNHFASDPIFVQSLDARQPNSPLAFLVDPWHRWDTGWYLKIAAHGYAPADGTVIFAPLYPLLMAASGKLVGGDMLLGGMLVSSIACLGFLILFYKLVVLETASDRIARLTLFAFVAFPTAFYLMGGYTESTFLVFVAGAFLAARRERWWLAAILAAGATLTRIQGWLLFFPLGWLALMETPRFWQVQGVTWRKKVWQATPRLAAMGSGPLMALLFFIYLALANLGSIADAYSKYWLVDVRAPWVVVIDVIGRVISGHAQATEIAGLVALAIIVALSLASLRKLPIFYHLYLWPTLFFVLLRYYPPTLLNGTMRYVLDFFPAFIPLGIFLAQHKFTRTVWVTASVAVQMLFIFFFAIGGWVACAC